jgi:NitT/TauT family transport system substrate-binding protein
MLTRHLPIAASVLGALALWLGMAAAGPGRAAEPLKVGTPEASAFMFAILDVGVEAGFFAKQDLAIDKINFGGGAKLQQAMSAGQIDFAIAGTADLAFIAKGVPEKAVATMAGAPVDMTVIVRDDADIRQLSDLKGKTIGVTTASSLTSWLAMELSRRQGWGADGIKRAYIGDMNAQIASLLVKNVDAIVGPLEGAYILQENGRAKPLVSFGEVIPTFIAHIIYASDAIMKDRPEAVRRFLHGWFETVKFVRANKSEAIRLSQPVTKLSDAAAAKIYDIEVPALSTDGRFDPNALAIIKQSLIDLGLVDRLPADSSLMTEAFLP